MARLIRWLDRWERRLCVTAFSVLAGVMIADVLLRELSGNGIPWAVQTAVYANLVVALFGLGLAASSGNHLRPRFADQLLPAAWGARLQRLGHLVTAIALLAFAGLAVAFAMETRSLGEQATVLRIPLWPLQLLIPLAFASGALRYLFFSLRPELAPADG
jgi:TRAP-type C4-dicarboxylate transport system permease small subunit